jgi:hypothetical protein
VDSSVNFIQHQQLAGTSKIKFFLRTSLFLWRSWAKTSTAAAATNLQAGTVCGGLDKTSNHRILIFTSDGELIKIPFVLPQFGVNLWIQINTHSYNTNTTSY